MPPTPEYPYWCNLRRNYYRMSSDGQQKIYQPRDSAVIASSSYGSGSSAPNNVDTVMARYGKMTLKSESPKSESPQSEPSPFQIKPAEFYNRGRVFATPRETQRSRGYSSAHTAVSTLDIPADAATGKGFRGGGQRYVVIQEREKEDFCYALAISTYGGAGVAKAGIVKADHGIIYSGKKEDEPDPKKEERARRGEDGMCAVGIRVKMRLPSKKLDPMSRIDYWTLYKFPKGSKVYDLGHVHEKSMSWLFGQYGAVQKRNARYQVPIVEVQQYDSSEDDEDEDEDEDGNEDEEEDEDEDEDEDQGPSRRQAVPSGGKAKQLDVESMAREAKQAQDAYRRLMDQGSTSAQALNAIAKQLQQTKSINSWQEAINAAKGRLRYDTSGV